MSAAIATCCCLCSRAFTRTLVGLWFAQAMRLAAQGPSADQEFLMRSWEARDGLPAGAITALQQTREGYLWIGTRQGLARFDGVRLKVFGTTNQPALRSEVILSLLADRRGNLWIGTRQGLTRWHEGRFSAVDAVGFPAEAAVNALVEDQHGSVWATVAGKGVVRLHADKSEILTENLPGDPTVGLVADVSGKVWWASRAALFVRSEAGWSRLADQPPGMAEIGAVGPGRSGGLWVAFGSRVQQFPGELALPYGRQNRSTRDVPQSPITTLLEDRAGRVWVGTQGGGVFCFTPEKGWQRVTAARPRAQGRVNCIYQDVAGTLWIGMSGGVLHQIKPRLVTAWSLPLTAHGSIPHTVCVAHDGSVWVGTDGAGAFRYHAGAFTRFGAEHGLGNATVISIFEDRRTNLWFGTLNGLFRFEAGRIEPVSAPALAGHVVSALFEDREGNLWIGTPGALVRLVGDEASLFRLPPGFRQFEVRAIAEDPTGALWVGTRGGGLFRLADGPPGRRPLRAEGQLEPDHTFKRPAVIALHCDAEGAVWIGTVNRGLSRLKDGRISQWTTQDGLPGNTVYAIVEDAGGNLWLSSNEGIFGVSKRALESYAGGHSDPLLVKNVLMGEGLAENWSSGSGQPAVAKFADGRLCFPCGHSIAIFDPAALPPTRLPASVLVEEVWVDGALRTPARQEGLRVLSAARRLEFHYTAPELDVASSLRFRYRLEGLEEDWVEAGAQRVAHYSHLPPGRYRFRVMAGTGGAWTEAASPLSLQIVPRLWETRWFQGLSVVVALGLAAGAARYRERAKLRRRLERLELQQAMERERRRIAQDLHDDVGAGLTEIMLLGELAKREGTPLADAQTELSAITEKTRQLATAMDEIVWTVNPKNDSLPNLASYICDYAREFFRLTEIRCRIDMPDALPPLPLTAHTRHNLFLAVKEALNNVAKHSAADEVWLRIYSAASELALAVEDNGRGFDAARASGSGNGLANMRARLQAVGGRMECASRAGQGTAVRFLLPLGPGA